MDWFSYQHWIFITVMHFSSLLTVFPPNLWILMYLLKFHHILNMFSSNHRYISPSQWVFIQLINMYQIDKFSFHLCTFITSMGSRYISWFSLQWYIFINLMNFYYSHDFSLHRWISSNWSNFISMKNFSLYFTHQLLKELIKMGKCSKTC